MSGEVGLTLCACRVEAEAGVEGLADQVLVYFFFQGP